MAALMHDPPGQFEVSHGREGPDVLVLRGELDLAGASAMRRAMEDLVSALPGRVVLDLSDLAFIDVSGVRAIERGRERLNGEGAEVVVRHPQRPVRRVLELCGLDDWVEAPGEVELERVELGLA